MTLCLTSEKVIYTYTAELFPTDVRTVGLGLGSLGGGVGGIVAPYILTLQVRKLSSHCILNRDVFTYCADLVQPDHV